MSVGNINWVRVAIAAFISAILLSALTLWVEMVMHGATLTFTYPPLSAFLLLLIIAGLYNPIARIVAPSAALTFKETLLVYCLLAVGSGLTSTRYAMLLPALIAGPAYYAGPENDFGQLFVQGSPSWLQVTAPHPVKGLYEGLPLGGTLPWKVWIVPLATWSLLMMCVGITVAALSLFLNRRWIKDEHLVFPLCEIPLEVTRQLSRGRRTSSQSVLGRGYLAGMLFAVLLRGISAAHFYFPNVPRLEIRGVHLLPEDVPLPWRPARPFSLTVMPAVVALAFLAPVDVVGSIWGFYLMRKMLLVFVGVFGWNPDGLQQPAEFISWQSVGAYLVMGAVLLRRAWKSFWSAADGVEGRARSWIIFSFVAGVTATIAWSTLAGMSPITATLFWSFFVVNSMILSRMAAEGGIMWLLGPTRPDRVLTHLLGSGMLKPTTYAALAFHSLHTRVYHGLAMPNLMQSLKIGSEINVDALRLIRWTLVGFVLVLAASAPLSVILAYGRGGLVLSPLVYGSWAKQPFLGAASNMATGVAPNATAWLLSATGAVFVALLQLARRYGWKWAPSPLGYLIAITTESVWLDWIWFSVFLAWLLKAACLRWGGYPTYCSVRRALIGVFVGDTAAIGLWLFTDAIIGTRGHWLFP